MKPSDVALNPTPLGYTVSLLIYLVPVLALYRWFRRYGPEGGGLFRRSSGLDYRRSAFRRTLLTLIPMGFLLDIIFGHAFLTFENKRPMYFIPATLRSTSRGQFPEAHPSRRVRLLHSWFHFYPRFTSRVTEYLAEE